LEFLTLVLPIYVAKLPGAGKSSLALRLSTIQSCRWFAIPTSPRVSTACDSIANAAPTVIPRDAREQLQRAREYHQRVFSHNRLRAYGHPRLRFRSGLAIAAEEGFSGLATDEGSPRSHAQSRIFSATPPVLVGERRSLVPALGA